MAEQTPTVTVEALQPHTYNGQAYEIGDTYEIAADLVDSITAQGKAKVAAEPAPPAPKPSQPIEPMTFGN